MNPGKKVTRWLIACLGSLSLLIVGLIAYSVFDSNPQSDLVEIFASEQEDGSDESEEQTRRSEGLRFRRLSLQDSNGIIDPDGLRNARAHVEKMKGVLEARQLARKDKILEAGVTRDSWTWLGPGNIGGRIRSMVIHPTNFDLMWVGSVSGGIWRTTNGGFSWFPTDDFMANLAVCTMVMNPANSNIMYAGTGENGGNADAIQGAGVFRSADGGVTWTQLGSTNIAAFNYVNRLAISPNGATLLAATDSGVWRSTDSGASWTQRTFVQAMDIDFHPTDSTQAIVAESGLSRFSTDGGVSWTDAVYSPATSGRIEMAYARSNGLIVYGSANRTSGVAPNVSNGEVFRSTDGGRNFTRVNVGNNLLGGQGGYDNAIWVNPQDPNFLLVGGVFPWRSVDGGMTFQTIGDCSTNLPHCDHHVFVSHPAFNNVTNRTVYFGNDGGLHRMENVATPVGSEGWTEWNNNLGITQFYGGAGNPATGIIIGGTQDNGTVRYAGGTETWTSTAGGDGGFAAADLSGTNLFYGETQNLQVFRSNNGVGSTTITTGLTDAPSGCGPTTTPCQTNFIAPLVLDPNEPTRLLAGGWSLWRTNDAMGAANWHSFKVPTAGNSPISAIAIAANNSDFIVVGHNNGDVYLTFDGTAALPVWSKIDTPALSNNFITRLVIDVNRSPNWIYATFGGFSPDNVYVTRNLGGTWLDVTGSGTTGLPNVPVRSLVFHPSKANLLYVGTEIGIFTSEDAGASWDLPNGGPANVSVDELFWMWGDLIVATHGRGMYRASGGLYVDCNWNGPQTGTFDQPFKTVTAAINALTTYRPIWVKQCNYNEQFTTSPSKRFELRSLTGSPVVGRP